jgi:hypothetical protein
LQDLWWEAILKDDNIDIQTIIKQMLLSNNGRFAELLLESYGVVIFSVLFNFVLREGVELENQW